MDVANSEPELIGKRFHRQHRYSNGNRARDGSAATFKPEQSGLSGSDSGHTECVGVTIIITGIVQVQSGGASMNATIQGALVCAIPT